MVRDFLAFVRRPARRHPRQVGLKVHAVAILTVMACNALFTLLVCLPALLGLHYAIGLDSNPRMGTGVFIFSALTLAPILEELMFRAGLRSAGWTILGMPVICISSWSSWKISLPLAGLAGLVWLTDRFRQRRLSAEARVRLRWTRGRRFIGNYGLLIYLYAILFASIHFSNFIHEGDLGWISGFLVLAVLSQFMGALTLSFLRLRYGLRSSMAAHCLWNVCAVGIGLLG